MGQALCIMVSDKVVFKLFSSFDLKAVEEKLHKSIVFILFQFLK